MNHFRTCVIILSPMVFFAAPIIVLMSFMGMTFVKEYKKTSDYKINWKTLNLKGRVSSITTKGFIPRSSLDKKIKMYGLTKTKKLFDATGNLIEEISYDVKQNIQERSVYKYEANGNYSKHTHFRGDGSVDFTVDYKYDIDGFCIYSQQTINNKVQFKKMVSIKQDDDSLFVYTRTQEDPLTDVMKYFERIKNGKVVTQTVLENNSFYSETFYDYDRAGNSSKILERTTYDTIIAIYKYDAKSNLIYKEISSIAGVVKYKNERSYDQHDNVLEEKTYYDGLSDEGRSSKNEYVYDTTGNWIKHSKFSLSGDLLMVFERQITY